MSITRTAAGFGEALILNTGLAAVDISGGDMIRGTTKSDYIRARGGNDTLRARR